MIGHFLNSDQAMANAFFASFYTSLLQDLLFVLTDSDHKSGFRSQTTLLAKLVQLVEGGVLQAPLFDPATATAGMTNSVYLKEYIATLLKTAFPHLQP